MAQNKRIAPFFNADGTVKEFTAQDSTAQNTGDYAVQNKNLATVGARYSINNVNGKDIVSVDTDQDIFEGVDRSEYGKVARNYIKEHFRGKNVDGISFTKQSEKEYTMSQDAKRLYNNGTLYDTKMKSSTELDNFVKTGTLIAHEETKHPHTYNEGGYNRYAVEFELGGKKFTGEMLVALNEKSEGMFYDIVKIKEKSVSRYPSASKTSLEGGRNTSSTSSIRYKTEKVNNFEEKSFEKDSQTVGMYSLLLNAKIKVRIFLFSFLPKIRKICLFSSVSAKSAPLWRMSRMEAFNAQLRSVCANATPPLWE